MPELPDYFNAPAILYFGTDGSQMKLDEENLNLERVSYRELALAEALCSISLNKIQAERKRRLGG